MAETKAATMRAIRVREFGGPEVLKMENVPVPVPQGNQILIQVKSIGINPVDVGMRMGLLPGKVSVPYTPGIDAAGIVTALGPDATGFQIGERVFVMDSQLLSGACAEYMLISSKRAFRLPPNLSFSQGAALGVPYFSVIRALKQKAHAKAGEKLLVHGASGGCGIAACEIGKAWKLDVVGTASSEEGRRLAESAGARLTLNHRDANHKENLMAASDGKGFDIILEMVGDANLATDIDVSAVSGRVVIIGSGIADVPVKCRSVYLKELTVTGIFLARATDDDFAEISQELEKLLKAGAIRPVIDREFPLDRANEAHVAVKEHSGGSKGKIILVV